jgi:protein SCO1
MKAIALLGIASWALISSCPTRDRAPLTEAAQEVSAEPDAGQSIYNLTSQWTDQFGVTGELGSLKGRVQVIAMGYTNCSYACPRIIGAMKRIEAAVPEAGFVIVSIDPERDTPEHLLHFAEGARLDRERYTLLHGNDADLLELAAVLGVKFRKDEQGGFVHSSVITVLDANGVIVYRQDDFDGIEQTIAATRAQAAPAGLGKKTEGRSDPKF